MVSVQRLRVSVEARMSAAAADFVLLLEKGAEMAGIPELGARLKERLTAAAEEIVSLFEETMAEYEARVQRSEQEVQSQRRLLEALLGDTRGHGGTGETGDEAHGRTGVEQLMGRRDVLDQQKDQKLPHIKEEEEEVWSHQEELTFIHSVKSENVEEEAQCTELHQREEEPPASSSAEHMKAETFEQDEGSPGPDRNVDLNSLLQPISDDHITDSESETDGSDCDTTQSGSVSPDKAGVAQSAERSRSVDKPFACSVCGKRFSLKGNLHRHIRHHTGERPFSCPLCEKRFRDKGSLKAHMRSHTGEQPYSCSYCEKKFSGKGNMKRHMRIHTGEKPFSCSICSKTFHVKEHLSRHMKYHTGEKPFSCSICGKGCAQKTDLNKHMRVHTGEKPYSCPFCGKGCAEKGDLTKHIRVHTGEKPFSCSVCGKSCAQKGELKIHMRTHTGEKPFSCSHCGKRFTVTGHLKRHMKLHDGGKSKSSTD